MKIIRWIGILGATLALLVAVLFGAAWLKTERDLDTVISIADPSIAERVATADPERGRYLFVTRGCSDCHGADGRGQVIIDDGPVMFVAPANITPAGPGDRYDADRIAAAIRHGLRADGRPLIFMPAGDWDEMSDDDVAALAAYLLALPAVEHDPGSSRIGPLGRVLYLLGRLPMLPAMTIDHAPRPRRAPTPGANAKYGFYVAQSCTGCHGVDFSGLQHGPPGTPRAADLRPGGPMAGWNQADFFRAMREGRRPDGSELDPFMPWRTLGTMSDVELGALWKYLQTLPPADG